MRYWRNLKRTKRYKEHPAAMEGRARAEVEANPDGPFRDVLVQFPKNPKETPVVTYGEPRVRVKRLSLWTPQLDAFVPLAESGGGALRK